MNFANKTPCQWIFCRWVWDCVQMSLYKIVLIDFYVWKLSGAFNKMLVCSCPLRILWISVSKLENSSGHCLPWFNQRPGRGSAGLLQLYRLHRAQTRHQLHKCQAWVTLSWHSRVTAAPCHAALLKHFLCGLRHSVTSHVSRVPSTRHILVVSSMSKVTTCRKKGSDPEVNKNSYCLESRHSAC